MRNLFVISAAVVMCIGLGSCGVNSSITVADGTTLESGRSTVNGGVIIGSDCTVNGNCRTVNGRVTVGDRSRVKSLKTVNGSVRVGDGVTVDGDLEAVNGRIELGSDCTVGGNVETVNGSLSVATGGEVHGTLRTVNGGISLVTASVDGSLVTNNGDITLEQGTRVTGDIVIRGKTHGDLRPPTITLAGASVLEGDIRIEDAGRKVRLVVGDDCQITGSTGAAVIETPEPVAAESSQ